MLSTLEPGERARNDFVSALPFHAEAGYRQFCNSAHVLARPPERVEWLVWIQNSLDGDEAAETFAGAGAWVESI